MSQDMPPSWRYLTSATNKLSSFKGYFSQAGLAPPLSQAANTVSGTDESRQSWRNWAAEKIRSKCGAQGSPDNEVITLFPGWAVRRYPNNANFHAGELVPFELEAFVSGYAITARSKAQASRSQRAFLRLAQRFAALPRITLDGSFSSVPTTPSVEEVLNHSPGMKTHEDQVQLLEQQLQQAKVDDSDSDNLSDREESLPSASSTPRNNLHSPSPTTPPKVIDTPEALIRKLHHNLETRLRPYWSSTLPARTVRLHLFASPHQSLSESPPSTNQVDYKPFATKDVTTSVDGSFSARFRVNWNDLCHHPQAISIAFGEPVPEHDLLVIAELLPLPPSTPTTSLANPPRLYPSHPQDLQSAHPRLSHLLTSLPNSLFNYLHDNLGTLLSPASTALAQIHIPITHCPIRVISDIDDTVKLSGVPDGARAVFHNVFVKELKDGVIPGMGEWYSEMWKKGVRFHYVSNGPFEYLSVLYEFFEISKLPPGSIKLKSYAGRSLLSGLLSTPAERKRAGVIEILDSFPQSRFILIGDSGEQDLELYADIARERPTQVLAVFIRDAGEGSYEPITDPTGWHLIGANQTNARSQVLRDGYGEGPVARKAGENSITGGSTDKEASSSSETNEDATMDKSNLGSKMITDEPLSEEPESTNDATNDTPTIPTCRQDAQTPKARKFSAIKSGNRSPPPPSLSYPSTYAVRASSRTTPTTSVFTPSITSKTAALNSKDQFITQPPSPTPPLTVTGALPRPPKVPQPHRSGTGVAAQAYAQLQAQYANLHPQSKPSAGSSSSSSSFSLNYKNSGRAEHNAPRYGAMPAVPSGVSSASTRSSGSWNGGTKLTEAEKRRVELQARVYRARTQMPGGVPLRVFRHPEECVEAEEILGYIEKGIDAVGARS